MSSRPQRRFSIRARLRSFGPAFKGLLTLLRYEHNARIHLAAALVAIGLGIWLKISPFEWLAVVLCIGGVFAAELFNTAIEQMADEITTEENAQIGRAKDLAAGGVLVMAIVAFVVGLVIFGPKLLALALFADFL